MGWTVFFVHGIGIDATTCHVLPWTLGGDIFTAESLEHNTIIADESSMVNSALLVEIVKWNPVQPETSSEPRNPGASCRIVK